MSAGKKRNGFMRILERLFPNIVWRIRCPATIEEIAEHFVENELPPLSLLESLEFTGNYDEDPWFAWRRRICCIYGVATSYENPTSSSRGERGWNRKLWESVGDMDPEGLVDEIFNVMVPKLEKAMAAHRKSITTE